VRYKSSGLFRLTSFAVVVGTLVGGSGFANETVQRIYVPLDFSLLARLAQSEAQRGLADLLTRNHGAEEAPELSVIVTDWPIPCEVPKAGQLMAGIPILNSKIPVQMIAQECYFDEARGKVCDPEDNWKSPADAPLPIEELVDKVIAKDQEYSEEGLNLDYNFDQVALVPIPRWKPVYGTDGARYEVQLATAVPVAVFDPSCTLAPGEMSQNGAPLLHRAKALISRLEGIKWYKAVSLMRYRERAQEGTSGVPVKTLYSSLDRASTRDKHFEQDCKEFWKLVELRIFDLESVYIQKRLKDQFPRAQIEIEKKTVESFQELTDFTSSHSLKLYKTINRSSGEDITAEGPLTRDGLEDWQYEIQALRSETGCKIELFRILYRDDKGVSTFNDLSIQPE